MDEELMPIQLLVYKTRSELFEKRFFFNDYYEDDLRNRVTFLNDDTAERLTLNWANVDYILTTPLNEIE
mgnify:CR=1 FL=1|jgi:hypothetical protein